MTGQIAIYTGDTVIYWSTLVLCLAVAAWFCLSYALYVPNGGRASAMWVFLPFACVFSLALGRFCHWYCHAEQYPGFLAAMTDYSSGSFLLPGVLLGVVLAALLARLLRFSKSAPEMLDALAPGAALGIALFRLSALFNSSCRGKIVITNPAYQRLPLGSGVTSAAGNVEYHFATFFVQFLLMLLLTALLLDFYYRRGGRRVKSGSAHGHTALLFLLLYSAMELVMDSTRYDSSFLRSNGFVSAVQIVSALSILGVLLYYSIHSVRANGLRWYHFPLWAAFLSTVGGAGYLEYLVQRHGDWYLKCYGAMSACCALMSLTVYALYLTVCVPKKRKKRAEA